MIYNIRGTNGSGKSYLVRKLMKVPAMRTSEIERVTQTARENLFSAPSRISRKIIGYYLPTINLRIVGKYEVDCGGCDRIKSSQEVKDLVREFSALGNVLFEGLLISGVIYKWIEFSKNVPGGMTWCYLDTPFELCMQNVLKRNGGKKFNQKYSLDTWKDCRRHALMAEEAGEKVVWLDHKNPVKSFLKVVGCDL